MIWAALDRIKRSRWAPWYTALGALIFLVSLFTIPYHVPAAPVISESYAFGYNNHAGELIVAVWLVLLALFGPPLRTADTHGRPLTRSTLVKALAITASVALLLYLATRRLNGILESAYFNDRLRLVLAGQRPYRDFEYAYGVGLLYVPAAMVRVLHLPAGDAYGLFWMALSLLGIWLLYLTLQSLVEFRGAQRAVFLLFWLFGLGFVLCLGVNYALLRFVLPCWLATLIPPRLLPHGTPRSHFGALLLPLPAYGLLLLVSPELALAFAIGISAYLLRFGRLSRPAHLVAFTISAGGMAAVTWIAARLGVFATLQAFRAGGYNFPLMPAPHLLLLFLLAGMCALFVPQGLRSQTPGVLLALIAASSVSLAGGLGRADQSHALTDPMGLLLAGFLLLSGYPRLRRGAFAVGGVLLVLQLPGALIFTPMVIAKSALPAFFAHEYEEGGADAMTSMDRAILRRMTGQLGPKAAEEKFQERRLFARVLRSGQPLDVPRTFGEPPGTVFYAPLEFLPDRFGVLHAASVDDGYFAGLVNVTTPQEVQRKRDELLAQPQRPLLLPPDFEANCGPVGSGSILMLQNLFHYPYSAPVVHSESLLKPLCDAIHTNFRLAEPSIPEHFGYLLWVPAPHAGPGQSVKKGRLG